MRDEDFDKLVKAKIQQEIKKPNSLEVEIMNQLNQKATKQSKLKIKIMRIIQAIVSVLSIGAITGCAYAAITGTSIFEILGLKEKGLKKASENYEQVAVEIHKKIETDNATIELNKIAHDDALLIIEYDITLEDRVMDEIKKAENGEDTSGEIIFIDSELENATTDSLDFNGQIIINGLDAAKIATYSEKISDKEFKLFEIVSLMDQDESNLKLIATIPNLHYKNYSISLNAMYSFLLDLSITNKEEKTDRETLKTDNTTIKIGNVIDTNLASFARVETEITNLSSQDFSKEDPTDISFYAVNENGEKLETTVYILKDLIHTENDEIIDLLNDYTGSNLVFDNRSNEFKSSDGHTLVYENGTLNQECLILFPSGIGNSSSVTIFATKNNETISDGISVKTQKTNSDNLKINKIEIEKNFGDKLSEYMPNLEKGNGENPYYTPNAQKIDLDNFEINGLKLGMTLDEAKKALEKTYNMEVGEFDKENGHFQYVNIFLWFNSNGKLSMINPDNASDWTEYGTTEKDFISKYYSEPEYQVVQKSHNTYKILYGRETFEANYYQNGLDGDYAYIYVSDEKDSYIVYYSNNKTLTLTLDPTTKEIQSPIELRYEIME